MTTQNRQPAAHTSETCSRWTGRHNRTPRLWSCFTEGTRILLCTGEEIAVEELVEMDAPVLQKPSGGFGSVAYGSMRRENQSVLMLETDSGATLGVTDFHPMVRLSDEGPEVVRAMDLQVGDLLPLFVGDTTGLSSTRVTKIQTRRYSGMVYNVALRGPQSVENHCIIANGIITGDLAMTDWLAERFEAQMSMAV